MKKIIGILLPILCLNLGLLSSCGNEPSKIKLTYGDINSTKVKEIQALDLVNKIDEKENFMFAVASAGCTCWSDFRSVVEDYILKNHLICYYINYNNFKDLAGQYNIVLSSSSTTFVIVEDGKVKIQMHSTNNNTMKYPEDFRNFMDANIERPHAYYISENDVDTIKVSDKSAIIYFERSACGDCLYLNPQFLTPYLKTYSSDKNLYIFDCQPWKELSSEEYQAKKDKYGLSTVNNPKYGYNDGVFPFLSYISRGNYESGAEAFNVSIKNEDFKYTITDSYYSEERLENLEYLKGLTGTRTVLTGMEIPADQITASGNWDHTKSINYYKPLVNAFLNYYMPKITFTF